MYMSIIQPNWFIRIDAKTNMNSQIGIHIAWMFSNLFIPFRFIAVFRCHCSSLLIWFEIVFSCHTHTTPPYTMLWLNLNSYCSYGPVWNVFINFQWNKSMSENISANAISQFLHCFCSTLIYLSICLMFMWFCLCLCNADCFIVSRKLISNDKVIRRSENWDRKRQKTQTQNAIERRKKKRAYIVWVLILNDRFDTKM